jgi:hypothetical protein
MLPITDLTVFRLDDILSCLPAYLRGFGLLKATRLGPICRAQCGKESKDEEILIRLLPELPSMMDYHPFCLTRQQ